MLAGHTGYFAYQDTHKSGQKQTKKIPKMNNRDRHDMPAHDMPAHDMPAELA